MSAAPDRDTLHRLVDELRPEDVHTARRVLQALNAAADPLLTTLSNAPVDDEPETAAERDAVTRARTDGNTVSQEDLRRKLRRA